MSPWAAQWLVTRSARWDVAQWDSVENRSSALTTMPKAYAYNMRAQRLPTQQIVVVIACQDGLKGDHDHTCLLDCSISTVDTWLHHT